VKEEFSLATFNNMTAGGDENTLAWRATYLNRFLARIDMPGEPIYMMKRLKMDGANGQQMVEYMVVSLKGLEEMWRDKDSTYTKVCKPKETKIAMVHRGHDLDKDGKPRAHNNSKDADVDGTRPEMTVAGKKDPGPALKSTELHLITFWLNSPAKNVYKDIIFCANPTKAAAMTDCFNLYRQSSIMSMKRPHEMTAAVVHELVKPFRNLLMNVAANNHSTLYDWIRRLLAHIIQKPWVRTLVLPIFTGRSGAGKTTFVRFLRAILGANVVINMPSLELLLDKFSGHLKKLCLVGLLDEFNLMTKKEYRGINFLVDGDTTQIKVEHQKSYPRDLDLTPMHLFAMNEEMFQFKMPPGQRRYPIFHVNEKYQGQASAESKAYFAAPLEKLFWNVVASVVLR